MTIAEGDVLEIDADAAVGHERRGRRPVARRLDLSETPYGIGIARHEANEQHRLLVGLGPALLPIFQRAQGTGGLHKFRWKRPGTGKSGGLLLALR